METPFYVGQTGRLWGRMKDYCLAQFQACTDFKVGEAIRYLKEAKNCKIILRYKPSTEPTKDEYAMIRNLQLSGFRLLNEFLGYNYKTADPDNERAAVQSFCEILLETAPSESSRQLGGHNVI